MSEPKAVHDSWAVGESSYSDRSDGAAIAQPLVEQLGLWPDPSPANGSEDTVPVTSLSASAPSTVSRETIPSPVTDLDQQCHLWEQEHATLVAELMQAQSLLHGQAERIRNLEQALDQSQYSLHKLQHQMIDQQFLETQLAATEEISNIQQQAIIRLKLQLAEQQQALDLQQIASQDRDSHLNDLIITMEAIAQTQQVELEHLRHKISRDRTEARTYQNSLERQLADLQRLLASQQEQLGEFESQSVANRIRAGELEVILAQTQTHLEEASQTVRDRQSEVERLEAELKQARQIIDEQPTLLLDKPANRNSRSTKGETALQKELAIAQAKVEELETEIARQLTAQAMLQHACQEMEDERERHRARITDLEQQFTDMQEQILRQAQQASEYETAVQHWKDRYFSTQSHVLKLKQLLEQLLPDPPAQLAVVLADLVAATSATELSSPALFGTPPAVTPTKVDLPDFLMRRRSYKTRRS